MCVAAIAWQASPRWRLVVAANRDEYHARPAAPLARWPDGSGVIAGRDLDAGGTWLGLSEAGRLALVTNFRLAGFPRPGRPSRGGLVTDLLAGANPAELPLADCNPCNLFVADPGGARFLTNHPALATLPLAPGIHGVSNGAIDAPWLKTRRLASALADWVATSAAPDFGPQPDLGPLPDFDPLFAALLDPAPTATEWIAEGPEPRLSAIFVADPVYGTRCSTVIAIDHAGHGRVIERSFAPDGSPAGEVALAFRWPAAGPAVTG